MIQLQTLGDAVIMIGDREVRPTSPTLFAALLYLGLERGQRVPRVALQELLFPETDERSGAHSLRQLLYKLRQLGASIQAEGDVVWLAAGDVQDDYSAPAHTNGNGNGNGSHGAFLAGYVPKLSAAFDEWLEARRTAIDVARRRTLIKQMLARRDVSDWITVERIAQEILAGDPFNGEATYSLAEATAMSGSKSEAIRLLERYESETGNADLKLPASILRKRISERLPDRRRRALDTPFVGRDAEAQVMREAVVRLRQGIGGTVVISGEPGIGKTRLLEETTALALLEGVNVHTVRCQPHYVNRPMGVFIEWVPMLLQSRGALGVSPEAMEHLKLLTSHSDDQPNRPTDARDDSTRSGILMAAVRDLVDAVASEAPIFLAVEDAHWADPTSLRDLCTLLERRRSHSLLVAYTTRVLEPLKEVGVLADSADLLRLRPLTDSSMLGLSQHLLTHGSVARDEAMDTWCANTAAGNPFYLQMLCGHFEDTRQAFTVPPSMRAATSQRVEQLSVESRRLLEYSALLGRHATLSALQALTELPHSHFANSLRWLEESGHLRMDGQAARLSHDFLRETTLELVPPLSRKLLHAAVGAFLEKEHESSRDSSLLWDCVEHWAASGESAKALSFVLRCAEHASGMGRATEAVSIASQGRRFAATRDEQLAVLEFIAASGRVTGEWTGALAATAEAKALLEVEPKRPIPWYWRFLELDAKWGSNLDASDSIASLTDSLVSAEATPLQRVQSAQLLVRIAHEQMNSELGHRAFRIAEPYLSSKSNDYASRMLPLMYHTSFGDREKARLTVYEILRDLGRFSIADEFRAARNVGAALVMLGDVPGSVKVSAAYHDRAERLGLTHWQYDFATNCCCAHANASEFADAEDWFRVADRLRRSVSPSLVDYVFLASGVDLALQLRNRPLAEERLRQFESLPASRSPRHEAIRRSSSVRIEQMDPSYDSPDSELEELRTLASSAGHFGCGDAVLEALAEALQRRGDYPAAQAAVREFLKIRRDNGPVPDTLMTFASQQPQAVAHRGSTTERSQANATSEGS